MSANLYWRQVQPKKGKEVPTGAPSSFMEAMKKAFNFDSFPVVLEREAIPVLRGMEAVGNQLGYDNRNPFGELADAIEKHDSIEVWAEW